MTNSFEILKILRHLYYVYPESLNVSSLKAKTRIHPRDMAAAICSLEKKRLIKIRPYRRGQSKLCSITEKGIKFLLDTSLKDALSIANDTIDRFRLNQQNRQNFVDSRLEKIRSIKNQSDVEKERKAFSDAYKPFGELLKKIVALQLFYHPSKLITSADYTKDPEKVVGGNFIVFKPNMELYFWWPPGSWPELDKIISLDSFVKHAQQIK